VIILDVRRDSEWAESHIDGAIHIPLHEMPARLADVPAGELWVHCRGGYRASVAASILDAAGRTVVAVDDEYDRAARAGMPVVTGVPAGAAA
jgi:hydroxyacylglutathione hydrolase